MIWFQVIIDDPLFLTYESFLQIIKCLKTVVNFEFVIVDGIEGSGRNYSIHSLQELKINP
ncbi:Hypothetical protein CSEC_1872 [Criblamydia sequanensis CRIB-18]|uniref:Uncharacterized protein n=1 Tax=Candidatus Criblamydia sequanensis CRIB-18 TaxID=1437425 RepID=A0A090E1R8_9BACT|nr:Hypothetical protein CSEC_1872 [Criblamydia sequanensis CRIB-18]